MKPFKENNLYKKYNDIVIKYGYKDIIILTILISILITLFSFMMYNWIAIRQRCIVLKIVTIIPQIKDMEDCVDIPNNISMFDTTCNVLVYTIPTEWNDNSNDNRYFLIKNQYKKYIDYTCGDTVKLSHRFNYLFK